MNKTIMYEFLVWLYKTKIRWERKTKLYGHGFIVYVRTDDMYKDIEEDVETRFDIANYVLDRPLPKGRKQNVIGLIKNEVDEKIMKELSD